ncbi:SUMO-activating enzyme subunit 1-like [Nothobranchius furzeri]|uniref:SUMO-activating enzyme subunit 1-like n=1 Tax=Nothobranchius furzeri TaxID=105023 RepID=A0A9D2YEB2_NOTFU|nr:SUMO-activating enzyme subunit 1-like [Nothobranchius furzeri]
MVRVDQLCFQNNIKFFCGDVYGYYGYMFCNLGQEYHYIEEKPKVVKPSGDSKDGPEPKRAKVDPNETTVVKKTVRFCTLKEALEVDWRSEKARAALKRTPLDYFLLLGMESQKKIQKISRNSERATIVTEHDKQWKCNTIHTSRHVCVCVASMTAHVHRERVESGGGNRTTVQAFFTSKTRVYLE